MMYKEKELKEESTNVRQTQIMRKGVKTYDVSKRVSPQARATIENTLESHEHHRKAYFWQPSKHARDRRWNEDLFEESSPKYQIQKGNDLITVYPMYIEKSNEVIYRLFILLNDKRKDIRLLKSIIKPKQISKTNNLNINTK